MSQFSVNQANQILREAGLTPGLGEDIRRLASLIAQALDEAFAAGVESIDTTNKAAMATGTVRSKPR